MPGYKFPSLGHKAHGGQWEDEAPKGPDGDAQIHFRCSEKSGRKSQHIEREKARCSKHFQGTSSADRKTKREKQYLTCSSEE